METIVIQTQSKNTAKSLVELAKKLGEKVQLLDKDASEDFAFGEMLKLEKTNKLVSKESILEQLRS